MSPHGIQPPSPLSRLRLNEFKWLINQRAFRRTEAFISNSYYGISSLYFSSLDTLLLWLFLVFVIALDMLPRNFVDWCVVLKCCSFLHAHKQENCIITRLQLIMVDRAFTHYYRNWSMSLENGVRKKLVFWSSTITLLNLFCPSQPGTKATQTLAFLSQYLQNTQRNILSAINC